VQVADGDNGPAVVYIDAARRSTISWLCREEMLQVRGSITIKPRPPTSPSETVRVGCGGTDGGDNRRALVFNISGTSRRTETSLTLDGLLVDGVSATGGGGGGGVGTGISLTLDGVLRCTTGGGGVVRTETSLTLDGLLVDGVVLLVRDARVTVVNSTLLDVSLTTASGSDHVDLSVVNSTWTRRYPNNLTSCEVRPYGDRLRLIWI